MPHRITKPLLGQRILVAEDHPDLQLLIRTMLESAGATVEVCGCGPSATALAKQRVFDVILMDLKMTGGDGITATRTLREIGYHLPIIAWSAGASVPERQRALEAGCTAFLAKPTNMAELLDVLRDLRLS